MKIITIRNIDSTLESLRPKPNKELKQLVLSIISNVQSRGDEALREYERKFSKINLHSFKVSKAEIKTAYSQVSQEELKAIKIAKNRLEKSENAVKKQLRS